MINNFKLIMDESGLKQNFVAKKTGISTATISAIYNGQFPQLETALKLARFFGKKVEEIWSLEEEA
jgi:putative transcriptional regulator